MLRTFVIALVLIACGSNSGGNDKTDATSSSDGPRTDGPPVDGSMTVDAAIGPGPACGATTCQLGAQVCCIGTTSVCRLPAQCPTESFECDGPEDCPAAVCCFPNSGGSRCQTNHCGEPACHVDADCPTGTPRCCPKMFTPEYRSCKVAC